MAEFQIPRLASGGLITTYACPSRCGHCLYNSGPHRAKRFMDRATAKQAARTIVEQGCSSLHIGGGEPLLDPDNLLMVIAACAGAGLFIDYVETNCSWYRDPGQAEALLARLQDAGLSTLLVSISPMHNEHIPLSRTKGVMEACRGTGMRIFPWVKEFLPDLEALRPDVKHGFKEYQSLFGTDYVARIPSRYWIHLGGRALELFRPYLPLHNAKDIAQDTPPCREPLDTSHFHVDLDGNYIPGLCVGLAVETGDLGKPIDQDKYPVLAMLLEHGVGELLSVARRKHGFEPRSSGYLSKCDLCTHIRAFLVGTVGKTSRDLCPTGFYSQY
ncbi:MAG: radical SAM protein [Desulfovibrio sp.]|nr:MAG: radical SAM protein [Desulfovibrio sp.]